MEKIKIRRTWSDRFGVWVWQVSHRGFVLGFLYTWGGALQAALWEAESIAKDLEFADWGNWE